MVVANEDLLANSQLLDTKLDARLKLIERDIKSIRDEQILMRDEQRGLWDEQTRIRLIIENDVVRAVYILTENYLSAAKRYENAADKINAMQTDIDIMKKVISDHSKKLKKIS